MKLNLQLKKMLSFIIIGVVSSAVFAQTNVENFDYPTSTLLTDASIGFTQKGDAPSINIYSPGLEYTGLAISGIGNAAHIAISEGGDPYGPERIARKPFFSSSVSSGTVYLSFLANIKSTIGGDFNNFFISVSDYDSNQLRGRVMAKDDGSGKVMFGFTKGYSTNINWTSELYDYNKTYFFVVKYEFVDGADNDIASLFVFEQEQDGVPVTEPQTASLTANDASGSDLANIKIVHLRQRKVEAIVDGVALGTSWGDVVVESKSTDINILSKDDVTLNVFQSNGDMSLNIEVNGAKLSGDYSVSIYNVNGQLITSELIHNQNKFTLDLNGKLQKGIYILNVIGYETKLTKKIMIR
ncbi:T9SS type A sorting domain-containing protein [Carboxylicivirga sp. M1479]|uniref:T9SS type A sorting domain-containing protein n=1 Tax=Carboxylicivirga sp. M1479 TaxID=2594476 RepID=UPI001177DDC4|nr:T9SS type A sorting domain-containing protein [Carboxylicivirga sp. M1479]TRX66069.1 T9SS type A sorting domain-containing protein [Carboxylicivirga sp. M1479]